MAAGEGEGWRPMRFGAKIAPVKIRPLLYLVIYGKHPYIRQVTKPPGGKMYKLWNVPYHHTQGAATVLSEHPNLDIGISAYNTACENAAGNDEPFVFVLTEPAGLPVCGA